MPTIEIPVSTYSVQQVKPNQSFGSPAHIPVQTGESRIYIKTTFDKIPADGTITNAILRVNLQKDKANSVPLSVRAPLEGWSSNLTWNSQPQVGSVFDTVTHSNPKQGQNYDFNVTSWAISRFRHGLRVETSEPNAVWLYGSAASVQQPKMIVTYTMKPLRPSNLQPSGGYVSVNRPILAFRGDDDMTEKKIEFSTNGGATVAFDTGWITSKAMTFNPANHPGTPTAAVGQEIHWRVTTRGPEGTSDESPWADYTYQPLPTLTITAPGTTTNDGTPTLVWTATSQSSFKVELYNDETGVLKDNSGWRDNATRRDYTPKEGVAVPGKTGRFELSVTDAYVPRVVAPGAPVVAHKKFKFTTVATPVPTPTPPTPPPAPPPPETDYETDPIPTPEADPDSDNQTGEGNLIGTGTDGGSTTSPNGLTVTFNEPVVTVTGTRTAGIPDEISLWRDGVQVTIWDADGVPFKWAPGSLFFTSNTAFSIADLTAPLRGAHTWEVKIKSGGTMSGTGPTVAAKFHTDTVWLVNTKTKEAVEILGDNGPAIEQDTSENAVLHVPINGGPLVEQIRRRIIRTTKFGSVSGTVLNDDDDLLLDWVEADSARRYRLVFGKVNWPVIVGDYSPVEVGHLSRCGPDRTLVSFNWWQRKED